jgi:catechol 2,3-dioxygenase-like lactoylglutathione lyase family enzyme
MGAVWPSGGTFRPRIPSLSDAIRGRNAWPSAPSLRALRLATHAGAVQLNHLNLRVADPAACRDFYCAHFGFRPDFEAEGGYFLRGDDGFLLALVPIDPHVDLPEGFHVGFGAADPDEVRRVHAALAGAGVRVGDVEDHTPGEDYVTFRCWDPDGTEIEVFWDG